MKTLLLTGLVSTWKWYKSTVVQEASAISSLLRHKHITVPLAQNHNHMGAPVRRWNFPTDKNKLTVQNLKLARSLGGGVAVWAPSMNEPLLSSTCPVLTGTHEIQSKYALFTVTVWHLNVQRVRDKHRNSRSLKIILSSIFIFKEHHLILLNHWSWLILLGLKNGWDVVGNDGWWHDVFLTCSLSCGACDSFDFAPDHQTLPWLYSK